MLHRRAAAFLMIQIRVLQTISHAIDMRDTKVFEIALDDVTYDEESENEMIQPGDLADLKPLVEDEGRYGPLHSHVKYYNERNTEGKKQSSDIFFYLRSHTKETVNQEQENKPFVAGFKHNLDKYFFKTTKQSVDVTSIKTRNHIESEKNKRSAQIFKQLQNYRKGTTNVVTDKSVKGVVRVKREETTNHYETTLNEEMDFFQAMRNRNVTTEKMETTGYLAKTPETYARYNLYDDDQETTSDATKNLLDQSSISERSSTLADNSSSHEESYDYERFKMEYEQQLDDDIKEGKVLNYTEKKEPLKNTLKGALKRIMDLKRPKNCTEEELSQIGIKAIECLLYDYQRAKDITTAKLILSRTWLVFRVWLLIYICFAIPCWCQRGWCCCCFRCKFCFPRKRIILVKQYYATNPPGIFVKDLKKVEDVKEPVKYEATEYEYNAYKTFEAAIRNI
ncbi:uncharacterized protein LOC143904378 isoform X1 [Temnothorax americanus]|uniref:uncharacterized protein LOC143904378 isoform X1 n=1 Tax=Temnothorax americanus TaxID=1964332 RepID=UPI00406793D5